MGIKGSTFLTNRMHFVVHVKQQSVKVQTYNPIKHGV